ncbi:hypothetical protein D3C80_889230 [compost metagenome]
MAILSRTAAPLLQFHYLFTVKEITVQRMEAHVFALSREEADMLFRQKCPSVWFMIDVRELGIGKAWIIGGRKVKMNRSHVSHVGPYLEGDASPTPFTDFLKLYKSGVAALPLPKLREQLLRHRGTTIPTPEQIHILADELGVRSEHIDALVQQEFRARWFENTVEKYGRAYVLRVISQDEFDACANGCGSMAAWEKLRESMPNFGVTRYYAMTAGELLFFHDMNNGTYSSCDFYSGAISLLDFPKRNLKRLCEIDSRFGELAAKEA